jgi:hypothetical protein
MDFETFIITVTINRAPVEFSRPNQDVIINCFKYHMLVKILLKRTLVFLVVLAEIRIS